MTTNQEDKSKAFRQVMKKSDYIKWQEKLVSILFYVSILKINSAKKL